MENVIEKILLQSIMTEEWDRIYPFKVDEKAKQNYVDAISRLALLKMKGKCDFEYTGIDENYELHSIYVIWNVDENNGFIELTQSEMETVSALFKVTSGFCLDIENPNEWQFTVQIYSPT